MVNSANLNDFLAYLHQLDVHLSIAQGQLSCTAPKGVLTPELREKLKARKAEILEFLQGPARRSTDPAGTQRDAPPSTSLSQERLWLLQQSEPRSGAQNLVGGLRFSGVLDHAALERTLKEIIRRHNVLRTSIVGVEGAPQAVLRSEFDWDMEIQSLRSVPEQQREQELWSIAAAEASRPLDLASSPLMRARLVVLAETDHGLLVSIPQVAADRWSLSILVREVARIYEAFSEGRPSPLPELAVQYVDYVRWHREYCANGALQAHKLYWERKLESVPVLDLPVDRRHASGRLDRECRRQMLPARIHELVQSFSAAENITQFITVLAAFQILLFRYTRQSDMVMWSTGSGRSRPELESLIGQLGNDLLLRTDLSGNPTARQLIGRIQDTTREAVAHENISPEHLGILSPARELKHTPPQVMFTVRDGQSRAFELPGLTIEQLVLRADISRYDLTVEAVHGERGLELLWDYNAALFDAATIERMQRHYGQLLEGLLHHPDWPISELEILTPSEQVEFSAVVQGPCLEYPQELTLDRWFEHQAVRTPEVTAVVCGPDALTYAELSRRSNRLANRLRSLGVAPGTLVGFCLHRSVEMAVALLGILKAGGAYVPLDPQYPRERIAFMLQDSQAAVLVTEEHLLSRLPAALPAVVCMDRDRSTLARESSEPVLSAAAPDDLAYVIYTSGSTGKPKGVEIRHRSVVNLLASIQRDPGISERDRLLAVTTLSFDIAGLEFYLPLVSGARLIIAPSDIVSNGEALARLLQSSGATIMQATPATWRLLLESGWRGTRGLRILCGGEAFPRELANRLLATGSEVWNMYGPTETTIWSTLHRVEEGDGPVPIGRPIGNTQTYVLDDFGHAAPDGVPGELYIGGDGVARGYFRRAELTAEKFVANPFRPGERLYRTGDLTRRRPDGNLEYIARLDHQVKIRGFRIELTEIEAVLEQQAGIRQAVVLVREDTPNDQRLTAYVISEAQTAPDPKQLRELLLASLPDYMVPASFVFLDAFPLTPNGKVDRRALPAPVTNTSASADFVSPRTELEQKVAQIWQTLLNLPQVGNNDNFFDLGGHSLLVVQLQSHLRRAFSWEISLAELFASPTVGGIARLLDQSKPESDKAVAEVEPAVGNWKCLVPVQTQGTRTPLFLVVGYIVPEETLQILSRLVAHLGPDQPIYGLKPRWLGGGGEAYKSIQEMASECIAEVRAVQPKGPYLLGGYCVAGVVALEMAQQLLREGEQIGMLALIDTARPTAIRSFLHDARYNIQRGKNMFKAISEIVFAKNGARKQLIVERLRRKLGRPVEKLDVSVLNPRYDVILRHWRLMHRYRPEPYPGPITLIVCEEWYRLDKYPGWAGVAKGGLDCHELSGDHVALLTVHSPELVRFIFESIARDSMAQSS